MYGLHLQGLKNPDFSTLENGGITYYFQTSVSFNPTIQRSTPEEHNPETEKSDNLTISKSSQFSSH